MPSTADPLADRLEPVPTWQVLLLAAGVVLTALLAIVLMVAVADLTAPYAPLPRGLHQAVVGLPIVLVLYTIGCRHVLRAPAAWFHAGRPGRHVLKWVVVGLAFPTVVLGVELIALGAVPLRHPIAPDAGLRLVVSTLAAALLAGVLEELAFRGALLRLLEARWGSRTAVAVTAGLFAVLHQGHANRPEPLVLVLASMLAAGLFLGVVAVRTRSAWNAVAVHSGWNAVFGGGIIAVSATGETPDVAILQFQLPVESVALTGGEATLTAAPFTIAMLLFATWIVASTRAARRPVASDGQTRPGAGP